MTTRIRRLTAWGQRLVLAAGVVCLNPALAGPGTLTDVPLVLDTPVTPNVMLLADDSGSMNRTVLRSDRASDLGLGVGYFGNTKTSMDPPYFPARFYRAMCHKANVLAYNPSVAYRPWPGEDQGGDDFTDVDVTDAPFDPYRNASDTVDLTSEACDRNELGNENNCGTPHDNGFWYVEWDDANGNDAYDQGECLPAQSEVPADMAQPPPGGEADLVFVDNLSNAEQQNYANWFTYGMKREDVAKSAMLPLAAEFDMRIGLASLHNNDIQGGSGVSIPARDMTAGNNRDNLMDRLARVGTGGITPLRQRLENVGQYYDTDDAQCNHAGAGRCPSSNGGGLGFGGQSPILPDGDGGSCQKNFTVAFTDGEWNGPAPSTGERDTGDGNDVNDTEFDGGDYALNASGTLADVAMRYYEEDLADESNTNTGQVGDLANEVPTTAGVDENDAQHMVTFGVAFGVTGTLDPATVPGNPDPNASPGFNWPTPSSNADTTIDDLLHASVNGRGEFLYAERPEALIGDMRDVFAEIASRSASGSSVSSDAGSAAREGRLFQATFTSNPWSGDILYRELNAENVPTGSFTLPGGASGVAQILNNRNLTFNDNDFTDFENDQRNIITADASDNSGHVFQWSSLTTEQRQDLRQDDAPGSQVSVTRAQERIAYLRGDQSNEERNGGPFRNRNNILGDFVNASPVFVSADETDSSSTRDVVYGAANDGMLHAFDADSGRELFAFIPDTVYSDDPEDGLHFLTQPEYGHRFYVDQSPSVQRLGASGPTILVGTLRGGGRGIYALDVSEPENFDDTGDDVLWEVNSDSQEDLGYTFSKPRITKLNNGDWGVIIGNGYNDPNDNGSDDGEAKLFILRLNNDGTLAGTTTITTGVGSSSDRNGLAEPRLADLDQPSDGHVDRVYAGDLEGNMWAFDLTDSNPSNWGVAGTSNDPLFTAEDPSGDPQPITAPPILLPHPRMGDDGNEPNILVSFGTGQFLTNADQTTTETQSFYTVWDRGDFNRSRTFLQQKDFVQTSPRVLDLQEVDYLDNNNAVLNWGWYIDWNNNGERVIDAPSLLAEDVIRFTSFEPGSASDPCVADGKSRITTANLADGTAVQDALVDQNGDGEIDSDDLTNVPANKFGGNIQDPQNVLAGTVKDGRIYETSVGVGGEETLTTTNSQDTGVTPTQIKASTGIMSWEELLAP